MINDDGMRLIVYGILGGEIMIRLGRSCAMMNVCKMIVLILVIFCIIIINGLNEISDTILLFFLFSSSI